MSEPSGHGAWWLVAAMTTSQAMVMFDITGFGVALPSMSGSLQLSTTGASWAVNAFVVAYAAFVALGGRLADRWDRMRVFVAGMFIFLLGSVACGLTPAGPVVAAPWLVAFRSVQGLGGALMFPSALAVVVASVPEAQRGRVISTYFGFGQVALVLGPFLGGVITQMLSWRWIFFVAVPLCVGATILVLLQTEGRSRKVGVPDADAAAGPALRWTAAPLTVGMALVVLGLERMDDWGWLSPWALGATVLGIACLALVVVREWNASDPLVHLRLVTVPDVAGHLTSLFLLQMVTVGVLTFAPVYFQHDMSLSPSAAGLAMFAFVGGWVGAVPLTGFLYDRIGPVMPKAAGAVFAFAGLAWWTWRLPAIDLMEQLPAMLMTGIGIGLSILPANTTAISAAPEERRAAGVGLIQTVRQGGASISVAVLGGLFLVPHVAAGEAGGTAAGAVATLARAQLGFLVLLGAMALNLVVALAGLRRLFAVEAAGQ